MSETIYLPGSSVKERQAPFGAVFKIGLNVEKAIEFLNANKNDRGYINFEMIPRKTPSDKGETHSLRLDTWKPATAENAAPAKPAAKPVQKAAAAKPKPPESEDIAPDDVPF